MKKLVPILIGLIFVSITFYLSFYFEEVTKNTVTKTGFGWVISTILLRAIVALAFARGTQLLVKVWLPKLKSWIPFVIGILLGFMISFITPIYEYDYGDYSTKDMSVEHQGLVDLTSGQFQLGDQPFILTFFTSDCPHCMEAAQLLGFAQSIGNTPRIVAIFPGTLADAERFINQNNGQSFEYYTVDDDQFFIENSGAVFPSVYLIGPDGQTISHWFGDEINFTALDQIESYSK